VRGFALNPVNRGAKLTKVEAYDVDKLMRGLTEPCVDTRQALMMSYFRKVIGQMCLFMLEEMDVLSNGKRPDELRKSKVPKQDTP
jgi:hypothetical protein